MAPRLELQARFLTLVNNVYFQPPATVQMKYPAIVYERGRMDIKYADNGPYAHRKRYQVTLITEDPDSPIVDQVAALPLCTHDSFFTANNLNHDVFTLYF